MQAKSKALVGVILVAAVCATVWFLVPRASSTPPAEVARKWDAVQRWTGVDEPIGRPVFEGALRKGGASAPAIDDALGEWSDRVVPTVAAATVPAPYRAEVDRILAWGAAPRFEGSCADPTLNPLALNSRLRAALMMAGPAELGKVKRALAVARALRARGSLMMTLIGLKLTTSVAEWARHRGVPVWPALRAAAPTAQEFVHAMAREAVCSADMVVREAGEDGAVLLALDQFKMDAHARLAPLQIPEPPSTRCAP